MELDIFIANMLRNVGIILICLQVIKKSKQSIKKSLAERI